MGRWRPTLRKRRSQAAAGLALLVSLVVGVAVSLHHLLEPCLPVGLVELVLVSVLPLLGVVVRVGGLLGAGVELLDGVDGRNEPVARDAAGLASSAATSTVATSASGGATWPGGRARGRSIMGGAASGRVGGGAGAAVGLVPAVPDEVAGPFAVVAAHLAAWGDGRDAAGGVLGPRVEGSVNGVGLMGMSEGLLVGLRAAVHDALLEFLGAEAPDEVVAQLDVLVPVVPDGAVVGALVEKAAAVMPFQDGFPGLLACLSQLDAEVCGVGRRHEDGVVLKQEVEHRVGVVGQDGDVGSG